MKMSIIAPCVPLRANVKIYIHLGRSKIFASCQFQCAIDNFNPLQWLIGMYFLHSIYFSISVRIDAVNGSDLHVIWTNNVFTYITSIATSTIVLLTRLWIY